MKQELKQLVDISGKTLLGNPNLTSGNIQEINVGDGLTFSGITMSVDLNTVGSFDYIDFNLGYTFSSTVEGRINWDEEFQTLSLGLHPDGTQLNIGQETDYLIKNQTGKTLEKGKVVRADGTLGSSGRILGDYMIADGTIPAKFTLGIVKRDIINGDDGYVIEFGLVKGIDTTGTPYGEVWNDGDVLWVSATSSGGLTNQEPLTPNLHIEMAIVIDASSNGSIFVRPNRYPYSYDLQDMGWTASSEKDKDIIQYDSTLGYFTLTNEPQFNSISAATISATAFYGDGSNLTGVTPTLNNGEIFVGDVTNIAQSVAMTGDVNIDNTGVTTIQPDSVTYDKMQDVTQSALLGNETGGGTVEEIPIVSMYLTAGTATALLENTSNWDINGNYIGTAITGTYQGQNHYDGNYFFTAVADDLWIRLIRG